MKWHLTVSVGNLSQDWMVIKEIMVAELFNFAFTK